jgi:hypothetical protein
VYSARFQRKTAGTQPARYASSKNAGASFPGRRFHSAFAIWIPEEISRGFTKRNFLALREKYFTELIFPSEFNALPYMIKKSSVYNLLALRTAIDDYMNRPN